MGLLRRSSESCLLRQVIGIDQVNLREECRTVKGYREISDVWERIPVGNCDSV